MGINIVNLTLETIEEVIIKADNGPDKSHKNLKPKDSILVNPNDELSIIVRFNKKKYSNTHIKDGGLKFILDRDDHTHEKESSISTPKFKKIDTFLTHHVQTNTKEKEQKNYREYSIHLKKHSHYLPVSMSADTHIDVNIKHPDT